MWVYIWTLYFIPLIHGSVLVPVPNCLDYCGFEVEHEDGEHNNPSFILPSQEDFGYLVNFVVPYEF